MMNIFTSIWLKNGFIFIFLMLLNHLIAQVEKPSIIRTLPDSSENQLNMDAVYSRPFLKYGKVPVAVGGYLEINSLFRSEDGVSEGLSFQARRLTLFMSASISQRIKFLSEIEFEEGGKVIGIEFAAMDIAFHPLLNVRGGIVMNPIGAFNQNHDGPKWEFIERPDMAVNLLPATWSNPGFGIYGKTHKGKWTLGYEAYLTNGFNDHVIDNEENKTFLPASKANQKRFEESSNGKPLFTGKSALKHRKIGELGISYMGGIYNTFEADGIVLDKKRRLDVLALDFTTTLQKTKTFITGEYAIIQVAIPDTYTQQYGSLQQGGFIDIIQKVLERKVFGWEKATLNLAARLDYVDWNRGTFNETGANIGDDIWAVTPGISFRPSSQTVIRLNYRYEWQKDILSNPQTRAASWLFGFSTYF